ncbi:MAG: DUF2946 family protein [Rubrivivax sp.]
MHASRLRRVTWLAIFAMLALALVPGVSHALAQLRGQSAWTEVCTTQGARLVVLDADADRAAQAPGTAAAAYLEHCPYCAASFGGLGLPPAPLALPPAAAADAGVPALFLHAPHTLHAWRSAQPRAPPSFS